MDVKFLSQIVWEWGIRCFGKEHMTTIRVRALRAAEEMIELNQACRVDADKLHELIDIVYARPVGEKTKEFGGVMVTTMVLARALEIDLEYWTEREVLRILSKDPKIFGARNQEKVDLGLT